MSYKLRDAKYKIAPSYGSPRNGPWYSTVQNVLSSAGARAISKLKLRGTSFAEQSDTIQPASMQLLLID
jgi:hypothetical protein